MCILSRELDSLLFFLYFVCSAFAKNSQLPKTCKVAEAEEVQFAHGLFICYKCSLVLYLLRLQTRICDNFFCNDYPTILNIVFGNFFILI